MLPDTVWTKNCYILKGQSLEKGLPCIFQHSSKKGAEPVWLSTGKGTDPIWSQICFAGDSVVKNPPANAGDAVWSLGLERSLVVRNGNPLQYTCLEKSMDSGARQTTVHEVTKSQTWPSDWAQVAQAQIYYKKRIVKDKSEHAHVLLLHMLIPLCFPDGYFKLCFGLNSSPSFFSILSFSWRSFLKKTEASHEKIHKLPASNPSTYLHWPNIPYLLSNYYYIYLCVSKDNMLICCCWFVKFYQFPSH